MSETLHDQRKRKDLLKHMILQLHNGDAPDAVRPHLVRLLGRVPYDEVVEVEQELINEGLPTEEVLKLCDIHTQALRGAIDDGGDKDVPAGHPVDVFQKENKALAWEISQLEKLFEELKALPDSEDPQPLLHDIRVRFNALMDVEKHYLRKENLLFPFLESRDITGPPTVMWGKHDETRELLKAGIEALESTGEASASEAVAVVDMVLRPAAEAVGGMIDKEEQILLPMCLDTLDESDWVKIARGSAELGYCLVVPVVEWRPAGEPDEPEAETGGRIRLPSGSFAPRELEAVLNTIPFDVTFVDADDTVQYFSEGRERIFARTRAILGRKVQYCHPPKSVDIVQKILSDFREGKQEQARFWIELGGKFICIEYFALRDAEGRYLGCLEVSQDLTEKRALTGQQRLLNYVGADGADE
ncbi:DUF438 domain-containing protein [bacterium]|nr:DUF438 domain-containing protein [bacterium]